MVKAYHGSNSIFKKFDQKKSRIINDFYGGGIAYFTDNLDVAKTYARSMSKKSGEPIIYEVDLNFRKLFDVDDTFKDKELLKILEHDDIEQFARGAGLLKFGGESKFTVLGRLREGKINLSGDQVFRGLSRGMNQTARARQILVDSGFDGLRYNGGLNMGMATKHSVYLAYKESNIKITKVFKMVKKRKIISEYGMHRALGMPRYVDPEESIKLSEIPKDLQSAYKILKSKLTKAGSKFTIKYGKSSNKLYVNWGHDYGKPPKLLKKEQDIFDDFAYEPKFRQFKGKISFSAESSGGGIMTIKESAPPSPKIEKWIKSNKKRFKDEYGDKEGEKILYSKAWKMYKEDAPVNNIGSGNIAGAPPDEPGVPVANSKNKLVNTTLIRRRRMEENCGDGVFGGHQYFTVPDECFYKCRLGKKNQEHYKTYVGDDDLGQRIKTYAYQNPGKPIIVQNEKTGAMMYLRYGKK